MHRVEKGNQTEKEDARERRAPDPDGPRGPPAPLRRGRLLPNPAYGAHEPPRPDAVIEEEHAEHERESVEEAVVSGRRDEDLVRRDDRRSEEASPARREDQERHQALDEECEGGGRAVEPERE